MVASVEPRATVMTKSKALTLAKVRFRTPGAPPRVSRRLRSRRIGRG
jgi:hypothetical protein